jgi:hypothetical protein
VVDGYLYRLDFSEGVEEGEDLLLVDALRQVADVDRPFEVILVHPLIY